MHTSVIKIGSPVEDPTIRSSTVKWVEIQQPIPTSSSHFVKLGFTDREVDPVKILAACLLRPTLGNKPSSISLEKAQEYANALTTRFSIPVKVITEPTTEKVDTFQNEFFSRNVERGQKPADQPVALRFKNTNNYREIIAFCNENLDIINSYDRAILNGPITALEKSIKELEALKAEITEAQKDVLLAIAEPYIDDIINACANLNSGADLVGNADWLYADDAFAQVSKKDVALAILLEAFQSYIGALFGEKVPGLQNLKDSATELQSMYEGELKHSLEDTLSRLGPSIPDIKTRRLVLLEAVRKKLDERFGNDPCDTIEGFSRALINKLQDQLFAEGCELNAIAYGWDSAHSKTSIEFSPRHVTLQALQGKLGTEEYPVRWNKLKPEEVQAKISSLIATVEDSFTS